MSESMREGGAERVESDAGRETGASGQVSLLRALLDGVHDAAFAKDRAGRYVYLNSACARVFQLPPERALGRTDADIFSSTEASALQAVDRAVMSSSERHTVEEKITSGRRVRTFQSTKFPWCNEAGEVIGIIGIARDITEQRNAEVALLESEEQKDGLRLQQLTAELEATVAELRRRTDEAEAARARSERTEEQARFLDEASRVLHSSLDHHETLRSVVRLAVPYLADRCVVHLVSDGHFDLIDSETVDISADVVGAPRYATWARIGPTRVARSGLPELYAEITDELMREAAIDEEHLALLRASGVHSAMVVPMKVGGRVIGTVSFLSVESKRRFGRADLRLAEELARRAAIAVDNARLYRETDAASKTKSEFLATMSHELRTPLNAISGYTDLLQLGISEPAQQQEHLSRIKASTWHLLAMIEEILTFSRLEAGRAEVFAEVVDARELVRDAAALLHPVVGSKGLTLDLRVPDVPLNIETDRIKIGHILMNLLSNAVKFTDEGTVTMELFADDEEATFRVTDTGHGIRKEDMTRIYEPFWQADAGTTRRAGGTGIGLAVANRLTELLAGRLDARSEVGNGSTFTLTIPRARPVAETTGTASG